MRRHAWREGPSCSDRARGGGAIRDNRAGGGRLRPGGGGGGFERTDIEEIEVFGNTSGTSHRIYALSGEVLELQRATKPLAGALDRLMESAEHGIDPEVSRYLGEVHDHVLRVTEQLEGFRQKLSDVLMVNLLPG